MTTGPCHPDLDRALQLAGLMLEAAQAGDWPSVATLQAECDALARHKYPADESTRKALLELQLQHGKLSGLVAHARDEIAREMGRHTHSHRALHAYLESSQAP